MSDISDMTVLTYDGSGYNVELARRLAREFGTSMYFKPWKKGSPTTNDKIIGLGYTEIVKVRDFFDVIDSVDLFVFPEIHDGDLQLDLERRGKRVWGARKADAYEYDRYLFAETIEKLGMAVPKYERCVGMDELRKYLSKHDDCYVKTNMRGDGETWHHVNIELSAPKLDAMDYYYGPVKQKVAFMVFHSVGGSVEPAYDGFLITSPDGKPQFPKAACFGYEDKSKSHVLTVTDYASLPEYLREVNDTFAPVLAKENMRSAFGTEVKKVGNKAYFLDSTNRQPNPPGPIVMEIVENLGEMFYHGAAGELVEAETSEKVGVQVNLHSDWAGENHECIQIPDDIRQWVKLDDCFRDDDGLDWVIPPKANDPVGSWRKNIGAVVALGNSVREAIETVKERCGQIESFDTTAQINSLMECLQRIELGNEDGVEFPVDAPEPAEVLGD